MRNTTKKQIKADLFDLIENNGSKDAIESTFSRLVFWKAEPYEFRGVRDAGLTDEELSKVSGALVGTNWFESIFKILCGE